MELQREKYKHKTLTFMRLKGALPYKRTKYKTDSRTWARASVTGNIHLLVAQARTYPRQKPRATYLMNHYVMQRCLHTLACVWEQN